MLRRSKRLLKNCVLVRMESLGPDSYALDDEKQPIRLKAEQARERIVKGESIDKVARDVSDGDTAMLGGELGCIGAGYGIGNEILTVETAALEGAEHGAARHLAVIDRESGDVG